MPQSVAPIYVHMVYSTKHRKPWLRDDDLRDERFKYMATILRDNVDSPALIINGVEDHIHALLRLRCGIGRTQRLGLGPSLQDLANPQERRMGRLGNPGLRQDSRSSPWLLPGL